MILHTFGLRWGFSASSLAGALLGGMRRRRDGTARLAGDDLLCTLCGSKCVYI